VLDTVKGNPGLGRGFPRSWNTPSPLPASGHIASLPLPGRKGRVVSNRPVPLQRVGVLGG